LQVIVQKTTKQDVPVWWFFPDNWLTSQKEAFPINLT